MDAVITYVNGNDNLWISEYNKYVKKPIEEARYRDWGTLPYLIKGIRKFMPFIDKIFLVVSGVSQVPNNIDLTDVRLVYHNMIIPERYLPCFNSCTIEMFLHNIPGLSNEFIYFNDDTFVIKPMKETDFFVNGKPVLNPHLIIMSQFDTFRVFQKNCVNSTKLIKDKFVPTYPSNMYIRQEHIMRPMLKSTYKKVWDKCAIEIYKSLTRTRHDRNCNAYLFNNYDYMTGNYVLKELNYKLIRTNDNLENIIFDIKSCNYEIICMNDNGGANYADKEFIQNAFENVLNGKNENIIAYTHNEDKKHGFSICLTAYQTREYIEECLDSIQSQTYFKNNNDYEIILAIDHCYDTLEKVKSIMNKYKNLTVIMLEKNVGTYIASNTAMKLAKYEWIVRFDTDDIMNPDMIETIAKNLYNYDIVQYKLTSFSTDGTKFVPYTKFAKGSIAIKKDIIETYGGYRPWICSADYELLVRLPELKVNRIDKELYMYRRTANCLTINDKTNGKSEIRKKVNAFVKQEINTVTKNVSIECVTSKYNVISVDTIIVNITTYPARDKFLYETLEHFTKQTLKPTKIILWLAKDEYNESNLPYNILRCLKDNLLSDIMYVDKNIYCHKRHECFKYFNYAFNIFIDDDIYYPEDFVEKLIYYSKLYNAPTSYYGKNMEYIGTRWLSNTFTHGPTLKNRYYGGLSCIPPNVFPIESFKYENERDIVCPKCDESWLQMWFIKNDIKVYNINEWKIGISPIDLIEDSQDVSMWNENKQVKNGILKKVNNIARCIVFLNIEDKAKTLWPNFNIVKSCDGEYKKLKEMSIKD